MAGDLGPRRLMRASRLHGAADKTDDAQDHDELHAAGDVLMNRTDEVSHYVKRWVEQLEERWVL